MLRNNKGFSALRLAYDSSWLEMVNFLKAHGALHDSSDVKLKSSEMIKAVNHGSLDRAKLLLAAAPDLINARDGTGATLLMIASHDGNLKMAELLVENGADVNAKDKAGTTALMKASDMGKLEIAELLVENGADVNAKDKAGTTALMKASKEKNHEVVNLLRTHGAQN